MKNKLKYFALGSISTILVFSLLVSVGAAVLDKTININYRDIKICVDGKEITPTDASGNPVEPFISEGTTYLPVRAVASAFNKEVSWDGETNTVYLGKQPGTDNISVKYSDVKNYIIGEVWNKGFSYIRDYVNGSYTDYMDNYIKDFADSYDEEFNIEKIRNHVLDTKDTIEAYNKSFSANEKWVKFYSEYNRLYNIVEKSEFNEDNFDTTYFAKVRDEFIKSIKE